MPYKSKVPLPTIAVESGTPEKKQEVLIVGGGCDSHNDAEKTTVSKLSSSSLKSGGLEHDQQAISSEFQQKYESHLDLPEASPSINPHRHNRSSSSDEESSKVYFADYDENLNIEIPSTVLASPRQSREEQRTSHNASRSRSRPRSRSPSPMPFSWTSHDGLDSETQREFYIHKVK